MTKRQTFTSIKLMYGGILAILLLLLSGLSGSVQGMPTEPDQLGLLIRNQKDQPHQASDETALAVSFDEHKWRQLGLMDTVTGLCDIAPAPNSRRLFAATYSPSGSETIWRSDYDPLGTEWEHILSIDTASDRVILRLSQNSSADSTIYAAEVDADRIAVSHNYGYSWQWHSAPGPVVDMVIKDKDTVYVALPGGRISKSTNGAQSWQDSVDTGLSDINMVAIADRETIIIGGRNGDVAYSTDGGASFTQIPEIMGSGNVLIVSDVNYAKNSIIYAGNSNTIYRWAIGASSDWETIRTIGANQQISGLAIANGLLYGAWYDTVADGSGVERSLEPTKPVVEWDTMDIGSEAARFDTTPNSLRVSSTATTVSLWAIDTLSPALMVYDDTLTEVRPTLTAPAQVPPDPVSGGNSQFAITWPRVSTSTEYDVEIYADEQYTAFVLSAPAQAPATAYRPPDIASPAWLVDPGQIRGGRDYYVRLRVRNQYSGDQIRSRWSTKAAKFTVAIGFPVRTPYSGPVLTAPPFGTNGVLLKPAFTWAVVPGVTEYELVLAEDAGFTTVVAGTPVRVKNTAWQYPSQLDSGTTYFWRVRPIAPVASDWSPVASFTTMAKPAIPKPEPPPSTPEPEPMIPYYITHPWLLLWITVAISAAVGIALLVSAVRTSYWPPAAAPQPAPVPSPEPEPEPMPESELESMPTAIEVTIGELYSAYKADKVAADAKFTDKMLKLTGVVGRIEATDTSDIHFIIITSADEEERGGVVCGFDRKHGPNLNRLTTGQTVTVQGKCDGYQMHILMEDCVLVR